MSSCLIFSWNPSYYLINCATAEIKSTQFFLRPNGKAVPIVIPCVDNYLSLLPYSRLLFVLVAVSVHSIDQLIAAGRHEGYWYRQRRRRQQQQHPHVGRLRLQARTQGQDGITLRQS